MLNKVIIMGRLTRDPEIKKVNNDISVCSFSIACDRDIVNKQNNERETDFFDVTAWRSTADFVGKYFGKGRMIVVVGRLQKRQQAFCRRHHCRERLFRRFQEGRRDF